MALTLEQVARKLWQATWMSRGRAPNSIDAGYWIKDGRPDFWNDLDRHGTDEMNPPVPDYAFKRALGWQSEGGDVPPFGPYANPPTVPHTVAVFPGDEAQPAPPEDRDREGTQVSPAPPKDQNPPFPDITAILEQRHYAVMGEFLAIRNQIAALEKTIGTVSGSMADQGLRFAAGLKAVKTIAAQLIAAATPPPKTATPAKPTPKKKAGTK